MLVELHPLKNFLLIYASVNVIIGSMYSNYIMKDRILTKLFPEIQKTIMTVVITIVIVSISDLRKNKIVFYILLFVAFVNFFYITNQMSKHSSYKIEGNKIHIIHDI